MARVRLVLRANAELRLTKNYDPLHSSSDPNLTELNVAEKVDQAMVATAVNTDQTMVPSSSSSSSSSSDGIKQNHHHDQFPHNLIEGREAPVNYNASQPCKSNKQLQVRHASNPDHGHTSEANSDDHNRIGYDQPLMKHEPIIIHARDPRIIHTDPGNFMLLVQSLTGSRTTRALCKQLEDQKQITKRKRNYNACTAADEVHETTVDDLTVNDGLQQQRVKFKQQQHQKKKQRENKNMSTERPKNMSMKRPAQEQQFCSQVIHAPDLYPAQLPRLSAHLSHESPSSSMDSHQKFAESPSLETDNLSTSPPHRLQDEGSMGSSPNISINDDDTGIPFSKCWSMFTDCSNSSPVVLPSFHGDQHDAAWTAVPLKFKSIIDSLEDHSVLEKDIICWPILDEHDVGVSDDGDLCLSNGFQLASAKREGLNMEDHLDAEYIHESSFTIPPIIDFNVSSLCRSMPEILDIDSLFPCAAE